MHYGEQYPEHGHLINDWHRNTNHHFSLSGKSRLKDKRAALEDAFEGMMGPHQRVMLQSHLRNFNFLDEEITFLDEEVESRLGDFEQAVQRVDEIPGVGRRTAEEVLAEIGIDMSRFPTSSHLASWARICPGNNESAGKQKSSHIGKGNAWLKTALVEAAWAASRSKKSYLSAQYRRISARRGGKRAIIAVAHTILVTIYHMLRDGSSYQDLGPNYFDEGQRIRAVKRAARRIERFGYTVTIEPA